MNASVTPEQAGWQYCGLEIVTLAPGESRSVDTADRELFVLPLRGSARVVLADATFDLRGRESVFTAVSDFCYVGRDSRFTLASAGGGEFALPSARCDQALPARYGPAQAVPVEVRGAGNATRQVTNFGVPGVWDHADRLMCCELITPAGNWSSFPSHKHDITPPSRAVAEEIYYYRIAGPDQITPSRQGYGLHRLYTGPEHEAAGLAPLDDVVEVRDGDIQLIPYGYHGPAIAAPGYPMYYLNVLAGPGPVRSMAFCDDPAHAWLRAAWPQQAQDPRCPVTSAVGRVSPGRAAATGGQ